MKLSASPYSFIPAIIAVIFLLVISALCSACYTLKQGAAMLSYLGRAVPLEEIARGESASEEDRRFAERVESIRNFAMGELGLAESKNYTRYVELDRDYLAAVVSASAKDSFTAYEWWFPVAGRVPYKGFFNIEDARKEREKLEKKELDVWVRGVDAFSTLGWFRDPLYSYMKDYSDRNLANLIIHELLHATVYLKNHSGFNEELAEFVGTEGSRLYMEKIRGPETDPRENDARADNAAFLAFIAGLTGELDRVYKSGASGEEKLKRKEEIIAGAKASFEKNYDTLFKTENYRGFGTLPVNNAYLELFTLYHDEDRFFTNLYEKSGRDLPKFIAAAKTLPARVRRGGGEINPRTELENALR